MESVYRPNRLHKSGTPLTNQTHFQVYSGQDSATKRPLVSVIIPTLNEEKNLPQLFSAMPDIVDELVLVDGRSTDRTIELAKQLRPDIKVVLEKRKGKGIALKSGFEAASGSIIVMLDADGSTSPKEIPNYVGALLAGADFAKGSRFMQGGGTSDMEFHRYMGNQFFVWTVRLLFGGKYTDLCYGYNAFWARTLPLLNLDGAGFEIETMMNVRAMQAGLRIAEVPSFENRRFMGSSNLRAIPDGIRVLKTIFKEWRKKPGLREVPNYEGSVTALTFKETFNSLLEGIIQLFHNRTMLSENAYRVAKEKLNTQYQELLTVETDCKECQKLQRRYQRFYPDLIDTFLPAPDNKDQQEFSIMPG